MMNKLSILFNLNLKITKQISIRNITTFIHVYQNQNRLLTRTTNINVLNVTSKCLYSSKKDKKDSSKVVKPKRSLTNSEMNAIIKYDELLIDMKKIVDNLKEEYVRNLHLRLTTNVIEEIPVKTPDGLFKLGELTQVNAKTSNLYVIDMIDATQYSKQIVEALQKAKLNLNPQIDKTSISLQIPVVTREHRDNLDKLAKQMYLNAKSKLNELHNVNIRKADTVKHTSIDTIRSAKDMIKYQLDLYTAEAEKIRNAKQKELLDEK